MIKRFFAATVEFLKEVKVELKKISYPSQSETIGSTTVVLIFVVIISIFLAFVDTVLARMIRIVIGV
jgi:preprotein translocase subunit SecE